MSLGSENCAAPLSAADVAAVTGHNGNNGGYGGFGGDWLIAIVILFLFPMMFGGGMWGGGMFGGMGGWGDGGMVAAANGALTRADLCSEFNFNGLENSVRGIQQGLCDGFYAMNTAVLNGFHGVDNAICTLGYQNSQLINGVNSTMMQGFNAANVVALQNQNALQTQLASCCCENRTGQMQLGNQMERGFCDVNYGAATNTNAIIQNAHNDTDRVIAKLDAMEMGDVDFLYKAIKAIKNAEEVEEMMEDGGYSNDGQDHGNGSSYARRGQHYVRGHYGRDGGQDGYSSRRDSRGRYSRDDGRSEMMEHIEMAIDAADGQDKEAIKRFMRQLEKA